MEMDVTQEPDGGPRSVQEHGSLLVLVLLAFAVGGTSGLVGAVFRLVLDWSDRLRGMVIDWAHGNQIAGFACVIGIPAIATGLAAWLVRKFAPGAKGSGIPDVEAVLRDEQPPPPLILIPVKFFGGVLAIGAGLALDREGPTVQMGRASVIFLPPCAAAIKMTSRHCWPRVRVLGLQRHLAHRSPVRYSCSRSLCGDLIRGSRSRRRAPRAAPSRQLGCFSATKRTFRLSHYPILDS